MKKPESLFLQGFPAFFGLLRTKIWWSGGDPSPPWTVKVLDGARWCEMVSVYSGAGATALDGKAQPRSEILRTTTVHNLQ